MALKIKKDLHAELLKIKRQKKGVVPYLISKGYSATFANNISKNWKELEVIGGPASTSTKTKKVVAVKKVATPKAKSKKTSTASTKSNVVLYAPKTSIRPTVPPPLPTVSASEIKHVLDNATPVEAEPLKELVVNISQGLEVKAEIRVKQLDHPRFFMGSLVKILQNTGAKVTFNAGLDLRNASDKLDGFNLTINEDHEVPQNA